MHSNIIAVNWLRNSCKQRKDKEKRRKSCSKAHRLTINFVIVTPIKD